VITREVWLEHAELKQLAIIMLVQLVASWQCGSVGILEVFKAEADFAGDCNGGAQVLRGTCENKGALASAPKMNEVVCAHNFFRRKETKPILQVTVSQETQDIIHHAYFSPNIRTISEAV
jgi:hypothetical protein